MKRWVWLLVLASCGRIQKYDEIAAGVNIEGFTCFQKDAVTCEHDGSKLLRCKCGVGTCTWQEINICNESCTIQNCSPP